MKKSMLIIGLFITFSLECFSQDYIIKNNNDTIFCKILKVNNKIILYNINLQNGTVVDWEINLKETKSYYINPINSNTSDISKKSDSAITFTNVIKTNDSTLTKAQLYLKGKEWFVEAFKSSKDVIQLDDKENGMIQGKGVLYPLLACYIDFTIKIWVKDGKYKYEFTNFIHVCSSPNGSSSMGLITTDAEANNKIPGEALMGGKKFRNKCWVGIKNQIEIDVQIMLKSLNEKMNEKTTNDW